MRCRVSGVGFQVSGVGFQVQVLDLLESGLPET